MKHCCRCKETLPKSMFHKHSPASDGLYYSCKPCRKTKFVTYNSPDKPDKQCCRCKVIKDKGYFHKDSNSKDGLKAACNECRSSEAVKYNINPDVKAHHRKVDKIYREANKESISARTCRWARENKDRVNACQNARRARNITRVRAYHKAWRGKNPDSCRASEAKRLAAKDERTVRWSDNLAIKAVYKTCAWLNKATSGFTGKGEYQSWHVDHIIPLRGDNVSGLHVENNLAVLTAKANMQKSNSFAMDNNAGSGV